MGESEKLILYDATALMLTVVVPVILSTLAVAWWFQIWQFSGDAKAAVGLFRTHRIGNLVDSRTHGLVSERYRVDWIP